MSTLLQFKKITKNKITVWGSRLIKLNGRPGCCFLCLEAYATHFLNPFNYYFSKQCNWRIVLLYTFYSYRTRVGVVESQAHKTRNWGSGQSDPPSSGLSSPAPLTASVLCALRNAFNSPSQVSQISCSSHRLECCLSSLSHWVIGVALNHSPVCTRHVWVHSMNAFLTAHPAPRTSLCQEEEWMENWIWEKQLWGLKQLRLTRV